MENMLSKKKKIRFFLRIANRVFVLWLFIRDDRVGERCGRCTADESGGRLVDATSPKMTVVLQCYIRNTTSLAHNRCDE